MPFDWPELDEVAYRLLRLWRLILAVSLLPVVLLVAIQLAYWPFTGQPPAHFIAFWVLCLLPVGVHVVLFPNAHAETAMIGISISILVLLEPLVSGFGVLRILELIALVVIVLFGQFLLMMIQAKTKLRPMIVKASVLTDSDMAAARQFFPFRPNQTGPKYASGPMGSDGVFAVTEVEEYNPFDRLNDAPTATTEVDQPAPVFWAKIVRDEPYEQETHIFTRDDAGATELLAQQTHRFVSVKDGVRVREMETVDSYPIGLWLGLWLTDFQKDGLVFMRDNLEGRSTMALRSAHEQSLLTCVAGMMPASIAREFEVS